MVVSFEPMWLVSEIRDVGWSVASDDIAAAVSFSQCHGNERAIC